MPNDPVMDEVMAATQQVRDGDRAGGRRRLEVVWAAVEGLDAMHECLLAHHLADAQDTLEDELAWDLRALDAASRCTDVEVQRYTPVATLDAFRPSLHLSLATDYAKLRDIPNARAHLAEARRFVHVLPDDAYGELIRGALAHLEARLG